METFKVWDELNSHEDGAESIRTLDAAEAAKEYAENDVDGHCDGIYYHGTEPISHDLKRHGRAICVRDERGTLYRYAVGVIEFEPVYGAEELGDAR